MFLSFVITHYQDIDYDLTDAFEVWLSEGVVPENRIGLKRILKGFGMKKYNMWELARHTRASLVSDPYWVAFNETDTFSKNSIRGLFGRPYNPLKLEEVCYRWKI